MANFDVELNDEVENFTVEFGEVQRITVDDFDKLRNRPSYAGQTMTHETNIPEVPTAVSQLTNDADYQTGSEVESAISTAVGGEKDAREQADAELSRDIGVVDGKVDAEADAREREDIALQGAIDDEETARKNADNGLQGQIDAITSSSDVVDIVGTYAELLQYPTAGLGDKDVIKVLQDETHNDAMSYYRWNKSSSTWSYIGSEGPYYTKSETNTLLGDKQDTLTAGSNITISSNNTISATDTTYTAGNGLTLTGTEFSADTTVLQPKLTAGDGINISAQNVISADIDPADFFTTSETVDGTGSKMTLNNTIQAKIKSVQMDGDTYQQTYSGKNLFNKNATPSGYGGSSTTVTTLATGVKITLTGGTGYGLAGWIIGKLSDYVGKTVTLSANIVSSGSQNPRMNIGICNDTFGGRTTKVSTTNSGVQSISWTVEDDPTSQYLQVSLYAASSAGVIGDYCEYSDLQLEIGSTATSYEPYTAGPSPNPDYPQDVQVVTGEQTVEVHGKNLIDPTNLSFVFSNSPSQIELSSISNGIRMVNNGGASQDRFAVFRSVDLTPYIGKVVRMKATFGTGGGIRLYRIASDGSNRSQMATTTVSDTEISFTVPADLEASPYLGYVLDVTVGGGTTVDFTNLIATVDSSIECYEPYQGHSYEINLGKNLFDKNNYNLLEAYWGGTSTEMIALPGGEVSIYIKAKPNTTYTASKTLGERFRLATTVDLPQGGAAITNKIVADSATSLTITTGPSDQYLSVFVRQVSESATLMEVLATLQIEEGQTATPYAPYFTPIELCKIGDYQDKIFNNDPNEDWYDPDLEDNAWYVHKETAAYTFDGSENGWYMPNSGTYPHLFQLDNLAIDLPAEYTPQATSGLYCEYFTQMSGNDVRNNEGIALYIANNGATARMNSSDYSSLTSFKDWLSNNSIVTYYALSTATDTQITDATLVGQLNALADALGYKDKTIITVSATGTNLPAILEVSAYRNSLAGVLGVIGRAEAA